MCDYQIARPMEGEEILGNIAEALACQSFPGALFIAPLGSMFDEMEVPAAVVDRVWELAAAAGAKLVATETRMEFLNERSLSTFVRTFSQRLRRINIGLESINPWILANSVGKSIPVGGLPAVANLLHTHGTELAANLLVGSPWLSPHEIIEQTLNSIRGALQAGVDLCVLFPSNVRRWTVQHWLWEREAFRPPSLWTFAEILLRLNEDEAAHVALSYFDKKPNDSIVAMPVSCPACQPLLIEALWQFSASGDRQALREARARGCACRAEWQASLKPPRSSLGERAQVGLEALGTGLCGESWWAENGAAALHALKNTP